MKNHIIFKFIAIVLCALCLLGVIGGAAGIIFLSEMDLYNKTVDEYLAQSARSDAETYAHEVALTYSSKILGGCSDDMIRAQIGDADWFYRAYPDHGYIVADGDGNVLSSYNTEADTASGRTTYTIPVGGKYMYLVEILSDSEQEPEPEISRTAAEGETYLYDAIQPLGNAVYEISVSCPDGAASYGSDSSIGFVFKDESGRVVFRGFEPGMDLDASEPNYFRCVDAEGEIIYEISAPDTVGHLTADENGCMVFTGNMPEPEATVPETTAETVSETTEAETVAENAEETAAEEAEDAEETTTDVEETSSSSASAIPEEETAATAEAAKETEAPTTEATEAATVPPTTAPVETVPDIPVTEPVLVDDKPLSSYQINRMEYYDSTAGEEVTAKYVYVSMPEMTVTLYVDSINGENAGMWEMVRFLRELRQYLLPMVGLCLLIFAAAAVYLCNAAGQTPDVPEIRAGGLNRIPLDLHLVGSGCLIALFVAGGLALAQYLISRDALTGCGVGILMCYCGCLVFVGFCYAVVAQLKTPDGFWWRNSLCGRIVHLCARFAKWLESFLSGKVLPWLVCMGKKLWQLICSGSKRLEKVVNRSIAYLPLVWQWLLTGCVIFLLLFLPCVGRSGGWLVLGICVSVAIILYGAYCFGKLMDSAGRMSKGDLDIKVSDKHMVGAFSQFAESLNNLADVAVVAAREQLKSERMKTELITNVSHDIKTPLTSIINYVDLLQKAQTEEERQQYLEVLDRQSQRLKKLIDDLMDMSKASTGNMSVDITRVDAVESVNQALGEFADKLDKAMLLPVFRHDEAVVPMMADGRLVWRVLSNLLSNAVKYALPGTRLYIDLTTLEGKVLLSVKNISREELNIGAEELLERFVRGDDSRNTEGSGLGLNIAKSLMELQKGELQLLVDGDLFKVTLIFPGI